LNTATHGGKPGTLARQRWAIVLVFVTPALWAVNYLVARRAPGVIEPHVLALTRWLLAGTAFAVAARTELWAQRQHLAREWKRYLVLGALGMWICGAWIYLGARTTTALNISLIYTLSPVLIAAASALWLKERLTRWQALGIGLALMGVLHVVLKGEWAGLTKVQWVSGDAWALGATVAWTGYSLLLKKWPSPLSPGGRLAAISFAGVLVLAPFALWEAGTSPIAAVSAQGLGLALVAAALPGYAAYLAYSVMQRELGAARVSVVIYLGPMYAAALGWLVLAEPLHTYHALGLALVLPGIYLVTRAQRV
jgi:drug/metabolite transporter (DMT)-like permease